MARTSRDAAKAPRRRGVATLIVLLLISITLALSYSVMRAQTTAVVIQQNANLSVAARQAAMTGIAAGIKAMHRSTWTGVDTTLARSLSATERFTVAFTTGDPNLSETDDDYKDYPYRVTLLAAGYARDPADATREASHRVRAVVRLVPRKLADEPADFANVMQHTVYQSTTGNFEVHVPFQVRGPVRVQRELELAKISSWFWYGEYHWYAWSNAMRKRYLTDLNGMRNAGYGDFRPFTGPIHLPYDQQENGLINFLTVSMQVPNVNTAARSLSGWNVPGNIGTYRIYPGGKAYTVPTLSQDQSNVTRTPNPKNNPLGIFYRPGELRVYDNVRIQGTVLTTAASGGCVSIYGKNVHFEPLDLPPLHGSNTPVQLPMVMSGDDLHLCEGSQAHIAGLLVVTDDFDIQEDWQNAPMELDVPAGETGLTLETFVTRHSNYSQTEARRMILAASVKLNGQPSQPSTLVAGGQRVTICPRILLGKIVTRDFYFGGRWEWLACSGLEWDLLERLFGLQDDLQAGIHYFPQWLEKNEGLRTEPQYGIRPDPAGPQYHWKKQQDPIYVAHPDDGGLRWELLTWIDNP